ncbi:tRNA 5'-guanylyltransferase [Planctomycetaceae bacterium SCGC AG-212-F19]|nr:tRNA 5'-guanylyltransferase [Planctomycetaceae bacterium SCGC AG-212-F19]
MKRTDFEQDMRSREYFHALRFLPGAWIILRVDGHGFSRLTESRYEKPFDLTFHGCMVQTAQALLEQMGGLYAYTESDEISLLLPRDWALFDRELEKAISLSAGLASSTFSLASGVAAHFDSRAWLGTTDADVVDYFRWRQTDATRCALNGWCYWTLRQAGKSVAEATAALKQQTAAFKNELLFQRGINFNDVPTWQRRGVGLYWEGYDKEGYNPKLNQKVTARRRRIKVDRELPIKEAYGRLIQRIMTGDSDVGIAERPSASGA